MQIKTEAGLLHERSGGSNTTFDVSSGSQATCVHQNTFEYIGIMMNLIIITIIQCLLAMRVRIKIIRQMEH